MKVYRASVTLEVPEEYMGKPMAEAVKLEELFAQFRQHITEQFTPGQHAKTTLNSGFVNTRETPVRRAAKPAPASSGPTATGITVVTPAQLAGVTQTEPAQIELGDAVAAAGGNPGGPAAAPGDAPAPAAQGGWGSAPQPAAASGADDMAGIPAFLRNDSTSQPGEVATN